jgi:hypothetical protein
VSVQQREVEAVIGDGELEALATWYLFATLPTRTPLSPLPFSNHAAHLLKLF